MRISSFNNKGSIMSRFYSQLYFAISLAWISSCAPVSSVSAIEVNPSKNPIERLIQGNQRYVSSTTVCHEDWTAKRVAHSENQKPFAVIVTCSDSRVPPEIIFDQSLGSLFVVRVAGNVVDDFAIGSIEYGVNILGANLVLVMGHSNCGAVKAALENMKFDNHIQEVLNAIHPAVIATRHELEDRLEKTIKANVKIVEEKLKNSRPLLAHLLEKGTVRILGAYYDLESGKVEFLDASLRSHMMTEPHPSFQIKSDGTKLIQDEEGALIQIRTDGTKLIKKPDGSSIEIKPDGTKLIQDEDGTLIQIKPDGTKRIRKSDGTVIEVQPNVMHDVRNAGRF